jgi:hypothetical protein
VTAVKGTFRTWAVVLQLYEISHVGSVVKASRVRRTVGMENAGENEIKQFYDLLLGMPWLSPRMRRAVIAERSGSVREYKRGLEQARTAALRVVIGERKALLQKRGNPRGGAYDKAVEQIASEHGMTVDALKQRLHRNKQRQKREGDTF